MNMEGELKDGYYPTSKKITKMEVLLQEMKKKKVENQIECKIFSF